MSKILKGKIAIITGASQGLGFEIAKKYLLAGADLMLCARTESLLEIAKRELTSKSLPTQKVVSFAGDVSKELDVKAIVDRTLEELGGCHILVNNAGVYGPKGQLDAIDWAEWVRAIEINLFGSVLMAKALLPHFRQQSYGKIIQLSGGGATNPMPRISAYAVSKAAVVRFAETLAEEVRGCGIDVNCVAPGALNTRMLDEVISAGPLMVGRDFFDRALKQRSNGGAGLDKGADLALFLASSGSDGITGKLISAIWDDWGNWRHYLKELNESDVYTLRRITGHDRGYSWGDK